VSALAALRARWDTADPYDYKLVDVLDAQLAAADESLRRCRDRIKALDRRATEAGVDRIGAPDHLVGLLFSHSTYKSYPDTFIRKGNWSGLGRWLDTLSVRPVTGISYDGVADIDDWVARLHDSGHYPMCSSGTTGKPSLVPTTPADHDALRTGYLAGLRSMTDVHPDGSRRAFLAVPRGATTAVQLAMTGVAGDLAGSDRIRFLSEEPMLLKDLNRMGEFRQAVADGTARPGEIAAFEQAARERGTRMTAQLEAFVDSVLEHRGEPLFIAAAYGMMWRIVELGRARGLKDGSFHPDTRAFCGGGLKGVQAPADFKDQIRRFLGPGIGVLDAYGMSELNGPFAACSKGRYHVPPTTILLPLDKSGTELLRATEDGSITCRCAALDLMVDGRWGGVISGDRVSVEYRSCECGRTSPAVHSMTRYTDLPEGDDKLSCGGSVDAYIRGVISDDAV
jgi:hypothetical protein